MWRFLNFLPHSVNRYRVHSPFLYSLIAEVLRKGQSIEEFEKIEKARQEYLDSDEIIRKTDYGVRKEDGKPDVYPVKMKQIASASLTSPRHARRLYRLARYIKADCMLEIGTSLGLTAAYLARANPEARIITLEGCPELCRKARKLYENLGITNIEVLEGRFEETLPAALDKLGIIDLVYIDGNHQRQAMLEYTDACLTCVKNDSVIVFDDIHASPGMEEAWEIVKNKPEVKLSLDLFFSGWIFFRKESSRQHYHLRYF
jgi:predicted O-methyltransferase YrrM